jgi:hypothetical protein
MLAYKLCSSCNDLFAVFGAIKLKSFENVSISQEGEESRGDIR